jgi:putative peptide zinc metalloprotease protein
MLPESYSQPKLRADLIISEQRKAEAVFFVFKDPVTGRFFRFREPECFIARQFDGQCSLDVIRERTKEKFKCELSPETLEQFVGTLRGLGFLEIAGQARAPAGPRRVGGSLLYLRLRAFDPDRLLTRLAPKLRLLFTLGFLLLSALVILLGLGIAFLDWGEFQRDLRSLWRVDAFLLAWVVVLLVTAIHEFAHGLTCKHFGGEVHEMGFLLIYLQPAFFCNVSDAWLFPEKSKRLWVTFAGAYSEMFIWGLATIAWRMTEPQTWVGFAAMVVVATSAIKSLFNLNPLIKLDGYYLLSDAVDIPNLRQNAFRYLRELPRRLVGRAADSTAGLTPRDRRILLLYGLLAGAYSFWLLSFVALQFGHYLVGRYQGTGFFLFLLFLMLLFRNSLRNFLSCFAGRFMQGGIMFSKIKRLRPALAWAALPIVVGTSFLVPMELKIAGEFHIRPEHNADVCAEVEATVEQVYVEEGQLVHKGDLLARLSDRDLRAELLQVQAEIREAQARLKTLNVNLNTGARYEGAEQIRRSQLSQARTNIAKLQDEARYAESDLERQKKLFKEGLISRGLMEEAEEKKVVRQKELESAEAQLNMVSADDRTDFRREFSNAQALIADISRLETQQQHLEEELGFTDIVSPISGVVTTHEPKEEIGKHMKKGDLLLKVHNLKTVTAEIYVPEKEIADVQVGQPVVLKASAYADRKFYGKVAAIAPTVNLPDQSHLERTVLVTTELNNEESLLKSEMTGNAKIYCGKRKAFDLLTHSLARYIRVEFWSWW